MQKNKGQRITEESYRIIKSRLGKVDYPPPVLEIVKRIAHATGDVAFAESFHIPPEALQRGVDAVKNGCPLISDVEMVRTGIRESWAERLGCQRLCFLNDEWVVEESRRTGQTRSHLGMRKAGKLLEGAVVAIGNAPTALYALLDMIARKEVQPALIVGVPVGFVGAFESKQALYDSGYAGITNLSERGGSTIAAAIVNGILYLGASPEKDG